MSFFGLKKVWLVGYSGRKAPGVNQLHDKVKKTALGAEKDLEITFIKNSVQLIKAVKKQKLKLVAIEQNKQAIGLQEWQPEENNILVFGNEVSGVNQKILQAADKIVEIPRLGNKGSLNVEVAAAVVMAKLVWPFKRFCLKPKFVKD